MNDEMLFFLQIALFISSSMDISVKPLTECNFER